MTVSDNHARFTAYFSVALAFLVALMFPVGYFVISHQHALGSLEAEAEINARIVTGLINANPDLWRFESERLEALLSRRPQTGQAEVRRILDAKGTEIATSGHRLQQPIISRSQPLMDAGVVVGRIEISRSLLPLIEQSALVAVIGLAIGLVVFVLLPFRAINKAERQLRDSYRFLTRVMESSTNAIIVVNLAGTVKMVNERCTALTGYRREQLLEMPVGRLFEGGAAGRVAQELQQLTGGAGMTKFETELARSDGSVVAISCGAAPLYQEGRISGSVLTVEDIAERLLAAQQLKHAKEYTENLIQAASVIIVGLDTAGTVTLMNRTAEEVTGYLREELTGKNWCQTVTGSRAFLGEEAGERLQVSPLGAAECQIVTKSGALRTISWRNSPIIEDGSPLGTLCFGIDVTEHKMVEEQLRQSQKMESIGRLAGGVAHDFNNMLSVILGYAELCKIEASEGSRLWQFCQEISKAGERSRDMVRQLLAFSRKELISPRAIDLNTHCVAMEKTLGRLIGEDVTLTFLPAGGLWTVKIDPSQADQILMNLVVNARDAMPGGGKLTVATSNATLDAEFCHYRLDARPGDYVCLTVSDTGYGMDRERLKRIFEPFFTTKEIGKGTGLGLSTVYGIVTQNGGFIDVKSKPGVGTSFMIYLPRLAEEPATAPPPPAPLPTGSGTLLLVEDDAMLLSMTTQMLEKIGYRVIRAGTPGHAIDICRDFNVAIDLLVADVVMPGMNGREMARQITALRPEMKVLFMSGYSSDIVAKRGVLEPGMHFIRKPFDMEGLHQKIQEALQQGVGGEGVEPEESAPEDLSGALLESRD